MIPLHLVVLATLFLGDLVDVVGQLLEVSLLLVELLLEFEEPLLLALANGVVLVGALAALEGVTLTSGLGRSTRLAGHCSCGGGEGGSGEGARAGKLGEGGAKHFCWRSFDCEDLRGNRRVFYVES